MAPVLPYTSKDTKYDNAKFRRRSALKVSPNLRCISKDLSFQAICCVRFGFSC